MNAVAIEAKKNLLRILCDAPNDAEVLITRSLKNFTEVCVFKGACLYAKFRVSKRTGTVVRQI